MTEHCVRRHVLVTGASSGIGQATAIRLAGAGDHVFATVRSQADADEFNQSGVTPVTMDVTNMHQIQAVFDTISDHTTTLNTLINNAGIGLTAPLEFVPLGSLRQVYEVNVIGQVAVIQAMLPLLRAASGVIVMIGTVGDRIQIPFGGPLASSKQAIRSLSGTLRLELEPWGIHVVLVQPGSIHTPAIDNHPRIPTGDAPKSLTGCRQSVRQVVHRYDDPIPALGAGRGPAERSGRRDPADHSQEATEGQLPGRQRFPALGFHCTAPTNRS